MGTKTWKNGGSTHNWSDASNWVEGSKPAVGDDVVIGAVAWDITLDEGTAAMRSLDMTGFAGAMSGAYGISIKPSTGPVDIKLAGAITCTTLTLAPATGVTLNFYFGSSTANYSSGITVGSISGGTWDGTVVFHDAISLPTASTFTFRLGSIHLDGPSDNLGLTHTIGSFGDIADTTRNLYLGNCTINAGGDWTISYATSGLTIYHGSSTINLATGKTLNGGDSSSDNYSYYNVSWPNGGNGYIGNARVHNLTFVGGTATTEQLVVTAAINVLGNLTLSGANAGKNRLFFRNTVYGTQRGITVAGINSCTNVDFQDIKFNNAVDFSATSSGDCGGNDGITFTTGATQTWGGGAGNWSDANWSGRFPLPQDSAVLTGTGLITVDVSRLCSGISFTGATPVTIGNAVFSYGSVDLTGMGSLTTGGFTWYFRSRARTGVSYFTPAGKSLSGIYIDMIGSTLELGGAYTASYIIYLRYGTFNDGGYSVTTSRVWALGTETKSFVKSGAWTFSYDGTMLELAVANTSWTDLGGSITFNYTSAAAKTFSGNGNTFKSLTVATGGATTITGSNTFDSITVPASATLTLANGSTQTVGTLTANGTEGSKVTLNSAGTSSTLAKSGTGPMDLENLIITGINVTPARTWFYGNSSTWNSGTGWGKIHDMRPTVMHD